MSVKAIVHYTRCWECMMGQHYDPPERHDWAGLEDLDHDPSVAGQPCACVCGGVRDSHVVFVTDAGGETP